MTIRVYLVDDHALVRTGMKMILSGETDIEVVGEAETGEDALREIRQLQPDVVLCDLHLPGVSGMEVTESRRIWRCRRWRGMVRRSTPCLRASWKWRCC